MRSEPIARPVAHPRARARRRLRRGVELVEFALVMPMAIVLLFATIEYAWFMFQRGGVVDAARVACRAAAQLDPNLDDVAGTAEGRVQAELALAGVSCGVGCNIQIYDLQGGDPPRVVCEVRVPYQPLTGLLGQSGSGGSLDGVSIGGWHWSGLGVLPDSLHGISTAVYEGI